MSISAKVEENKRVANKCREMGEYNAGASRAYYSAFQRAKSFLLIKKFDYQAFRKRIHCGYNERDYSHGTIKRAVTECLLGEGKDSTEVAKLTVLDSLYRKRLKADYDERDISVKELDDSILELETILSVIN